MNEMVGIKVEMVLVWDETLYSRIGKNEMVWIQHGIWMRTGYRGWHGVLNAWLILFGCLNIFGMWSVR